MSAAVGVEPELLCKVAAGVGRITLNRPRALNALTHGMIRALDAQLAAWGDDASVRAVLLDGAGERGLCAGGDIRALYEDARAGRVEEAAAFFRDEYRLNARIARYAKPFVAVMDGIVMGGGIGLGAHAAHRVVTPRSVLAMPEVGIGFIPDVGGTYLLARAPGELGTHAALAAARLGPADAMLLGLADRCVPVQTLGQIARCVASCLTGPADAARDSAAVAQALDGLAEPPPPGVLAASRGWIDAAYAGGSMSAILAALRARPEPAAQAALAEIDTKSPTSLTVALRLLRQARVLARLEPCLQQEYDAARACLAAPDFIEGVRAAVVDKDRNPHWSPAALDAVTPSMVAPFFPQPAGNALGF